MGVSGEVFDDFVEPIDVRDVFVNGIARIDDLGGGLVRVSLYATEGVSCPMKVIRLRLLLQLQRALEMNAEAQAAFTAVHRANNPLRRVQ